VYFVSFRGPMTEFPESDEIRWGISRSIFHPSEDFNNTEQWKQRLGGGACLLLFTLHILLSHLFGWEKNIDVFFEL